MSNIYGAPRRVFVREAWFWIAMVILAIIVIAATFGVVRWVSAPTRGKLAAREQIQSGASRIAAYNHFFDLCAAVQAQEGALAASYAELQTAVGKDAERVRINITGLTAQRSRSVAQYNADARKDYTIGQFRASGLPYELPATFIKGETTSCGS